MMKYMIFKTKFQYFRIPFKNLFCHSAYNVMSWEKRLTFCEMPSIILPVIVLQMLAGPATWGEPAGAPHFLFNRKKR